MNLSRRERRPSSVDARAEAVLPARLVVPLLPGLALVLGVAEAPPSSAVDRSTFGAPAATSADMILSVGLGALRLTPADTPEAGKPYFL